MRSERIVIHIPDAPTRKELIELADSFVKHTHDPEGRTHRTIESRIHRGYNKLDQNNDKRRMPFDVAITYLSVIVDMCMDKVDDKFAVNVSTTKHDFSEEDFKAAKYDRRGDIRRIVEVIEQRCVVQEMMYCGVWVSAYARGVNKVSAVATYIKKCGRAYKELKEVREREQAYKDKALSSAVSIIEMKAKYGEVSDVERRRMIVDVCREFGMTQKEVSEYTGIPLATVKRASRR